MVAASGYGRKKIHKKDAFWLLLRALYIKYSPGESSYKIYEEDRQMIREKKMCSLSNTRTLDNTAC
jgi:hypothetical protein